MAEDKYDPYKKYTEGIYTGKSAYERAMLRLKEDPLGPIYAESERKITAGTQAWSDNRKEQLKIYHAWELDAVKKSVNGEIEAEELRADHLNEIQKLNAENTKKHWEYKFKVAETYTSRLQGLFDDLYTAYGKQSKELFLLSKAASIATIIVKTSQGIMDALSTKDWPMALLIGAEGAAQMAVASSATMARGGLIQGYSPTKTSDNIPISGTAGEFVHPVDAVNYYGTQVHEAMRQRLIPRELFTGLNLPSAPAPSGGGFAGGGLVGSAGRAEFTIVNLTDPRELDRYLATPAGRDAVLNVLSSSPVAVRRVLRG